MSTGSLLMLMGEPGDDFTEKFTSPRSFCKWCNLVPNNKISGGKLLSSKVPRQKNHVGQVFSLCANSLKDAKNESGYYFRRMKSRGGHLQAIVATANKIAKIFFVMIKTKQNYEPKKAGSDEKTLLQRKIERTQKCLERLNVKLGETG